MPGWRNGPAAAGQQTFRHRRTSLGWKICSLIIMNIDDAIKGLNPLPGAYVLCEQGKRDYLYKGSCRDLVKRMKDHKAGRVSKTKNRRPLELVYYEYCDTYTDARKRESFFKSGKGREFLKNMI